MPKPTTTFDIPPTWSGIFTSDYPRWKFEVLMDTVRIAYERDEIYPHQHDIFRALEMVRPEDTKIVILGQDPYPSPGNAHGLSFSVMPPRKAPASLRNIFCELERSIPGWKRPAGGNLEPWSKQGVLLLNTILTVVAGNPLSHAKIGWDQFCLAVISHAQKVSPFIVFILWGNRAQKAAQPIVDLTRHTVLKWSHPSPLAQNRLPQNKRFVGNNHFVKANALLSSHGITPVDWSL